MEDLPYDVKTFLQMHPFLELTDAKKIKCTLNGHEFPCNLTELQKFTSGKKYKRLSASAEFSYSQYEPHIVPSTKQPNHLFCKLTLRHINRVPHHVLRHVSGKRYQRALQRYEECVKNGVEFVPVKLKQKKKFQDDSMMTSENKREKNKKMDSEFWAPNSSEGEGSDSEDSLADLYPPTLFTLRTAEGEEEMKEKDEEEDEFQTDDEDMDVMEAGDQASQKRRKVQPGGFKKFKKNKKRQGFKRIGTVKNGK
ncbi:surfeit locus protein 2 [Chanos chanos]|uniref:Surfeit locus protein 2 n=1 Tax=Chanos chanos TaxID=29144 RepID=A0A6J2V159_CHACN|nr:surfeit locus protein 2 [Chanos chanos]